ncbi:MAG: ABC transporter ATP-binding protein [Marinifilaceae bacterium]|nr:ABC transporter ATP-binding protein [Marinifilaceae bacterium]
MGKKQIIQATNLKIGYKEGKKVKVVHQKLNFQLNLGELTCLLGANGAGKSTLLRTLSAAQQTLDGQLFLDGKPISEYSERERSTMIGVVLTDKIFAGGLSVYELISLGRQPHTGFFGRLGKRDHEIIKQAMKSVGIEHKSDCYVAELSDGERQKAMIAKALVQESPLIILDEPTAFLDVVSRIEIMQLLHKIATEQNRAVLLSTHDIDQALVLADKLWLLTKGQGIIYGTTEDIILQHKMENLFPGSDIKFDYDHGVYYPTVYGNKEIAIYASNKTTLHWTLNALNRVGFACTIMQSEEENSSQEFKLYADSPINFRLINGETTKLLHSFEELLETITHT